MGWAKFDDRTHRKRKVRQLSDAAFRLYISAVMDCCAEASDGVLEGWVLRELLTHHHEDHVRELLAAGLLHDRPGCTSLHCHGSMGLPVAGTDLFVIHDFLQWQISRAEWEAKQAAESERALLGNHKRWHVKTGKTDAECKFCRETGAG